MAHEAIINFLFNSEGAMREIDNFKSRFSKALDGLAESASGIGKILGVGGGLTAGFAVKSMMDHIKLINDLKIAYSEMPIEEIGRFSNALRLMGATPEEATDALNSMQDVINRVALDGGNLPKFMTDLGLRIEDDKGRIKTAIELAKELDEALRHGKGKTWREAGINAALKEAGLSGGAFTAMKRLVTQNDEEREEFEKKLNKFWVPSAEDAERIQKFSDSINTLKLRFDELGKVLLDLGFQSIIDGINKGIEKFNKASPETQKTILYLVAGLMLLKPTISTIKNVTKALKALGSVFKVGGGLLALAALIGMVVFNVGGAHDALDEWIKGFEKWADEVEKEHPKVGKFLKMLGKAAEWISHPWDKIFENFGDYILEAEKKWNEFKEFLKQPFELPDWIKELSKAYDKGERTVGKFLYEMLPEQAQQKVSTFVQGSNVNNEPNVQITNYITADMSGDVDRDKFRAFTDRIAEGVERGTKKGLGLQNMSIQFGGQTVGGR